MPSPFSFLGRALAGRRADERRSILHSPGLQPAAGQSEKVTLTSPDFADGAPMPLATTAYDANQSPALSWSGVPEGTAQLVLVMEDIDVPIRTPMVHTVAVLDAGVVAVERGQLATTAQRFLKGVVGKPGYHGPRPIVGHGAHRYRFHLYALDTVLPESVSTVKELPAATAGHVLARGSVTGTFTRD